MQADWLNDPEYAKLLEFLVEKTKKVKQVLSPTELAREFKIKISSPLNVHCIECRIQRFRSKIHKMSHFDTETKVKLIFGLSGSVDHGFLRELRKYAEVKVDNFNRIIHYKKNGGELELEGKHNARNGKLNNQILEFLAKKVKKTSGIIPLSRFARKFKAEMGYYQTDRHLQKQIRQATKHIYESELFNEDVKVRIMFATCTEVEDYALEELRKNAFVVVDEENRIKEYKKKDGSLYLNEKESQIDKSDDIKDSEEEDVEEEDRESGDDSEEEEQDMKLTTKSGRLSKKRMSDASLFDDKNDMGRRSPRNEGSNSSNTSKSNNKKRKISEYMSGSVEITQKRAPEEYYNNDYSIDVSNQPDDENRVKLEPFNGPLKMDLSRGAVINDGDDFVEEIPAPIEKFVAPKYEEMLMDVKMEEPEISIFKDSNDTEIKSEKNPETRGAEKKSVPNSSINQYKKGIQKDETSMYLILESFHDFIDTLNLPILSTIQKIIESKLEECKDDVQMVSNEEIYHYLEVCLLKVSKNRELKESEESFRLESFISHLQHAVAHMKCPSLIEFQEKLKGIIGELRVQNKFIPVTAIRNALQSVIDNIINS